ncbi:MAG: hypothetical protein R2697_21080 [Ilumatobacteraceae bacterium]
MLSFDRAFVTTASVRRRCSALSRWRRSSISDAEIVQLERVGVGGPGHRLSVGSDGGECGATALRRFDAVVTRRHDDAGGEPLDVPFERAGERLVEVVEVEHQPAVGAVEEPEVGQVGVTAEFDPQPARRHA